MSAQAERSPRRRKETPKFTVVERICHGVEVVQIGGMRRYHVTYESGRLESPEPSNYFFDTVPEVLNNHERVVQRNLGLLVQLPQETSILIPGEAQKMSELSGKLTTLAGKHIALATYDQSTSLKSEIASCHEELGDVRNPYKVAAKQDLQAAYAAIAPPTQLDAILSSALMVRQRNTEALRIAQGTLGRWRIVFTKREDVERSILTKYRQLAVRLAALSKGELDGRVREQAARQISGSEGLLVQLNEITWPEYWQRIQDRDVQRLSDFSAHVRAGNDAAAIRILDNAISKLWRVVEDREKRERGEREK